MNRSAGGGCSNPWPATSLACAALQVDASRLAQDVECFGFVFESMVVREAEANLLKLARERVDTARAEAPQFLMVVTGGEYARTLPSCVDVVPLAALGA
jgi:hypothetical protein